VPPEETATVTGDERVIEHEWIPIGTLLLRRGLIDVEQLELALAEREQSGRRLGELLVSWGWLSSRDVAVALAEQFQLPFHDLAASPGADALTVPDGAAPQLDAVVVEEAADYVLVGVGDPTDIAAIEELRDSLDKAVHLCVIDPSALGSHARTHDQAVLGGLTL
jgi:MSHA biogenesis protein MshE